MIVSSNKPRSTSNFKHMLLFSQMLNGSAPKCNGFSFGNSISLHRACSKIFAVAKSCFKVEARLQDEMQKAFVCVCVLAGFLQS